MKLNDSVVISETTEDSSLDHKHKCKYLGHCGDSLKTTLDPETGTTTTSNTSELILSIERKQTQDLILIDYSASNVTHVYNPLEYASETHTQYVRQYGNGPKKVMFLGMNPGPFGMAQNGVRLTNHQYN